MSCAYRADIGSLVDNPRDVQEGAYALKEVAEKKAKEVHRDMSANEERFVGRAATPHHGHLRMNEARGCDIGEGGSGK